MTFENILLRGSNHFCLTQNKKSLENSRSSIDPKVAVVRGARVEFTVSGKESISENTADVNPQHYSVT